MGTIVLVVTGLVLVCIVAYVLRPGPVWHRSLPDFSEIADTNERKNAFFAFLNPYIEEANAEILAERSRLSAVASHSRGTPLNRREDLWIRTLAVQYDVEIPEDAEVGDDHLDALLERVDVIPPSLALAQAALESGWGTSRFARQGNNLFGIWCYTPGCGIVPRKRPASATYEVKSYESPKESFLDYLRNLNSNQSYATLWEIRETLRSSDEPLSGLALADGLYRYSEEGWGYVSKVQRVIESNDLQQFDEPLN